MSIVFYPLYYMYIYMYKTFRDCDVQLGKQLFWLFIIRNIVKLSITCMGTLPQFKTSKRLMYSLALRKYAYSSILKILPPKNEKFPIKNSYILHISDQNIDCGYSLEPPR